MKNITDKIRNIFQNFSEKEKRSTQDLLIFFKEIYESSNDEIKNFIDWLDLSNAQTYKDIENIKTLIEKKSDSVRNEEISNEAIWIYLPVLKANESLHKEEFLKLKTCLKKLTRFRNYGWLYNETFNSFWTVDSKEKAFELLWLLEKQDEELTKQAKSRTMYEIFWIKEEDISKNQRMMILENVYEKIQIREETENEKEKAEKKKEDAIKEASKWNPMQANAMKNISELLDEILKDATDRNWSDIHIEPKQVDLWDRKTDLYVRVRFRINWDLIDQPQFSFFSSKIPFSALRNLILSRSWMNMDNVRMTPLDGKFTYFYTNEEKWIVDKKLEIRVATVPILWSQWIVMRILWGFDIPDLRSIWLITDNSTYFYDQYLLWLKKSQGMVLVTWPTGSWKTSTLNSTMKYLTGWDKESLITWNKRQETKYITCEDPVEIVLNTTMQSPVSSQDFWDDSTSRLTFENYSKSALRLDPDAALLGEIRDATAVNIAIKIAITWHQLLGTLHTSSCASTITRIIWEAWESVIESLTDALNMILAQRLVKVPCPHCSVKRSFTQKEYKIIKAILEQCNKDTLIKMWIIDILWSNTENIYEWLDRIQIKQRSAKWCEHCNFTWTKWRVPLFEIMLFDRKMKRALLEFGKSAVKIEEFAVKECWMPLLVHWWIINMLEWKVSYEDLDDLVNLEMSAS